MKEYLNLLRVHQYVKNGFIFLPLFFALKIEDPGLLFQTAGVAAGFCLVASSIYIFNDMLDRKEDRKHPVKKLRPLAAGTVSVTNASILAIISMFTGLAVVFLVSPDSGFITLMYLALNIGYSAGLKQIAILDINLIAVGFVIRVFVGAEVGDIALSMWIILMTFLLALFLALAKRRDDVLLANMGKEVRKSVDGYNLEFINGAMMIMASVTIVAYISYTISEKVIEHLGTDQLYLTVFFVILGIFRYMQLTFVHNKSGSPTKVLLSDIFLQLTIVGWMITFFLLIYSDRL